MSRSASSETPIHPLISRRWSPYSFSQRSVAVEELRALLEAARWAASSYNEQPWRFLVARREDAAAFEQLLSCLVPANQAWARRVPVLLLTVTASHFRRNGKANRVAEHDLGLAIGNLSLEATARDLFVHQMAGVDLERARESYSIPEGWNPCTALAVGYLAAEGEEVPAELRQRDQGERQRRPLEELVFAGEFGRTAEWL